MARYRIIDSHVHCGVQNVSLPFEQIRPLLINAGFAGVGLIPPVEDIYDRFDYYFEDNPAWQATRRQANRYLRDLQDPELKLYPYFFVWNDFVEAELGPEFYAIKWHRHADEPEYHYEDVRCVAFLDRVHELGLPILLEETASNTIFFIEILAPEATVIIPHLGALNGGFRHLEQAGIWSHSRIYADTALATLADLRSYLDRHGSERLFFGSDYPFGHPAYERDKILSLGLPREETQAIFADNWLRLMDKRKIPS
ncbi:MAG: amidohydrolase family protein [Deltaproteobacteria bacterium]|nr:amidohydrolase family protein [Deltaproteobacteria bacterium]MBW1952849.1 amidohydrolase family protein [Deltaproteobacteria bacterium]MBW1985847.1 amidohydrolase family protein [Deltaproteobacteria bacterium]MBW2133608.1 amidohydrolase family protein [Deltaproteobacteria bacterium]